jgi:sigma-B regulation protein RsbU (phosphoserine phosphatase)
MLNYASAGQHPALLVNGEAKGLPLQTGGAVVGVTPETKYSSAKIGVLRNAALYLFSDGVFEIARPDGSWQPWEEFSEFLEHDRPSIDAIVQRMRDIHGFEEFEDDFSLLKMQLP